MFINIWVFINAIIKVLGSWSENLSQQIRPGSKVTRRPNRTRGNNTIQPFINIQVNHETAIDFIVVKRKYSIKSWKCRSINDPSPQPGVTPQVTQTPSRICLNVLHEAQRIVCDADEQNGFTVKLRLHTRCSLRAGLWRLHLSSSSCLSAQEVLPADFRCVVVIRTTFLQLLNPNRLYDPFYLFSHLQHETTFY